MTISPRMLFIILFSFLAAGAALAEPQADRGAAREDLLQRLKSLESESHRQRIRILEEAEDCIQAARDFPSYRACERQENDAREALREQSGAERRALREDVRKFRDSLRAEGQATALDRRVP